MKKVKTICAIILLSLFSGIMAKAQPIPAELMLGNKYGTLKMIVSKNFSQTSKFGIFHINILQFDYLHNVDNGLMLQDLLFFEPIKNFRITGGGLFSDKAGFLPTASTLNFANGVRGNMSANNMRDGSDSPIGGTGGNSKVSGNKDLALTTDYIVVAPGCLRRKAWCR